MRRLFPALRASHSKFRVLLRFSKKKICLYRTFLGGKTKCFFYSLYYTYYADICFHHDYVGKISC